MWFETYIAQGVSIYNNLSWKLARSVALLLLFVMFILMVVTSRQESATMDELAHIPAGYSYVKYGDMRINPEHLPLLKDIAGLPLLFLGLNFPDSSKVWVTEVNGQWELGSLFLYESGNDPDRIVFWARMGPILLTVLLGFLLFKFGAELFGKRVALMALALFVFSPAILAHGKYVTTDIAAAFGFFVAIIYFLRYLKAPSRKNLIMAGLIFGVAQALKFSVVLLIPFFLGIAALWALTNHTEHSRRICLTSALQWGRRTIIIFIIGYVFIIWPLYQLHVLNYPSGPESQTYRDEIRAVKSCNELNKEKIQVSQFRDTVCNLKTFKPRFLADAIIWMSDKPLARPYGQYALGFLMVGQRTAGGNTTYFLGEVSNKSWWYYFPVVYVIKEPLAMHILTISALTIFALALRRRFNLAPQEPPLARIAAFVQEHFTQLTMVLFVLLYWVVSLAANLNIGVRHVIPTFPFVYLLVSQVILSHLRQPPRIPFEFSFVWLRALFSFYKRKLWKYAALGIVLVWYIGSALFHYPYFTAYFNELVGGAKNGHNYVTDSNLDWGQDVKRLARFVEENNIEKIHVDYFGGGSPRYYLKGKYEPWWSSRGPTKGWLAVSATLRQGSFGKTTKGFVRSEQDSYLWLRDETPLTAIGHSIFVYRLE